MGIGSWFQEKKDKFVDDVIPNELKSGAKAKESLRKLIPNELADVAVKAAPFVAPFSPETAAAMRAFGRFDQRGSISDALKQGAMMYTGGKLAGQIPGTGDYFGKGFEGAKALGSDALSGVTSIFKGGSTPGTNEIAKSVKEAIDMYPTDYGYELGKTVVEDEAKKKLVQRGLGSIKDFGLETLFGEDKKFQMGDIGRFLGDPGKTIPLTMLATYIKEKFFPDEDTNSPDARYAQAMRRRGEDVEKYLREYGPIDFRRDPNVNPYTDEEIEDFVTTNLAEYQGYEDGGRVGIMSVPRENYFLGGGKTFARAVNPNPDFERASTVTPDDILNVFKEKFDEGVFFKGRLLPKSVSSTFTANPEMPLPVGTTRRSLKNIGKIPKASKVSSDDILNVFKEKFDEGDFSFSSPRLALPMGRKVSSTFSPKKALTAERAFDVDETRREIKDFFERRLSGMPERFRPEIMENEEIMDLYSKGDQKGLNALMTSLLRNANFDRFRAARGGDTPEENAMQAAGIEGLDLNINPKGVTELDMRETGGFIPPVGVKEKADDIPAMLSNNEFVFTADAVRAAGGGSVDKGAQRMYKMMKDLEAQV